MREPFGTGNGHCPYQMAPERGRRTSATLPITTWVFASALIGMPSKVALALYGPSRSATCHLQSMRYRPEQWPGVIGLYRLFGPRDMPSDCRDLLRIVSEGELWWP
jgi:hypothetical protein